MGSFEMAQPSHETVPFRATFDLGDDVRVDLISEGVGPVVVLLPSKARCSEDFGEVASGIARRGFRVLRPQPRGCHASSGPSTGVTMEDLASDVAGVLLRENSGPAVVVGHAFGNWPARMLVVMFPELVRGVVLAAAAARSMAPEQRADVRTASDPTKSDAERLSALRRSFFAPGHDPQPWLTGWHATAASIQDQATAATPRESYWHAGAAPLLDLIPEHDPFKPPSAWQETRSEFGDRVTTRIVPGASHALFPEQPRLTVDAIVDWAASLPR